VSYELFGLSRIASISKERCVSSKIDGFFWDKIMVLCSVRSFSIH
jgi:hypothetical protein